MAQAEGYEVHRKWRLAHLKERAAAQKLWRDSHPEVRKARDKKRRLVRVAKKKAWLVEYSKKGCVVCGEARGSCLVFHHVDPDTKGFSVSRLAWGSWGLSKLKAEVAKCVLLCANCHRAFHASEFRSWEEISRYRIAAELVAHLLSIHGAS
ncbi:hypothetical protein LCGC14_1113050 [marine sediment metagenome]|uniref:HNH nuclease domain-containing protein n=1 Tax=marine sediment metagenome TaxID=412755 RepID=A0A0F9MAW8_9ZZZZ